MLLGVAEKSPNVFYGWGVGGGGVGKLQPCYKTCVPQVKRSFTYSDIGFNRHFAYKKNCFSFIKFEVYMSRFIAFITTGTVE